MHSQSRLIHLLTLMLLLVTPTQLVLATPVPRTAAYSDIEKLWAKGQRDERELHSGLTHRDMTPAWSMHARDAEADEDFASASWMRTSPKRTTSLMGQMQAFAERVLREKGLGAVVGGKSEVAAMQVTEQQRPWKPEYYFSN